MAGLQPTAGDLDGQPGWSRPDVDPEKAQLYAWGWRVPFVLGLVIAPLALYIRRRLPETIQKAETHESGKAVLANLVRHHSCAVILGIFIISGSTISTYVFNYMNTYAVTTLHLSQAIGTILTLTGAVASLAAWPSEYGPIIWTQTIACRIARNFRGHGLPGISRSDFA